jgi:hypothetical protein
MIGALIVFVSSIVWLLTWMTGIRPYLSRHGQTKITAASWGVSAWADWQQCWEFAATHHDRGGLKLSRLFIASQIAFVIGIVCMLSGI